MGIFPRYLPAQALATLHTHSYQSGDYTSLDNVLNHWWNYSVNFLPLWVAPNILTVAGFGFSCIVYILASVFAPTFSEAMPTWAYWAIAICIFLYQTLDAIDGKQARRTKSSSPLGTLFDHGCDIFTSSFITISATAIARTGVGFPPFTVVVLSAHFVQFLFLWWEYHFDVFISNPGYAAGVTEAQTGVMALAVVSAVFGSDLWGADVLRFLPDPARSVIPIQSLSFCFVLLYLVVINNLISTTLVIYRGIQKLPTEKRLKALLQTASFVGFMVFEWLFYESCILRLSVSPPLIWTVLAITYSTIAVRILLSSTTKRYYHSLQWPCFPFCGIALLFTCAPYVSPSLNDLVTQYHIPIIYAQICWQSLYLGDLLYSSVSDICSQLNVRCFTIHKKYA